MKIIDPSVTFNGHPQPASEVYANIAKAGRTCYLSEPKENDTDEAFIRRHLNHEAILEHGHMSLRFVCDRGVTHELVRHRLFSFCQESTRYCNYGKGKFGSEITVIRPLWIKEDTPEFSLWEQACLATEGVYLDLLEMGWSPQQARTVLPNSTKAVIVVSGNFREWRHFFRLRKFGEQGTPHPQMKQVADLAWALSLSHYPALFEDLIPQE